MLPSRKRRGLALCALPVAFAVAPPAAAQSAEPYDPAIDPSAFSTEITGNPYLSLPVGTRFVLEAETDEGIERTEIMIPGWTRTVMGVETLVYWDRVYLDGELIEDTRDYLAQHENGDVWYFGEHVDNYEDGELHDHDGAWLAGVDGGLPGIWQKAQFAAGDRFRQEYYPGEAEDMAEIVSVGETVETPIGTFRDCVKTFEWSPLSPDTANKYYCRATGTVVLEVDLVGPETEEEVRTVITELDPAGALGVALPDRYAGEGVVAAR